MNESDDGNLKGFYSYKNTFGKDSVWLDIPKHGTYLPPLTCYLPCLLQTARWDEQ